MTKEVHLAQRITEHEMAELYADEPQIEGIAGVMAVEMHTNFYSRVRDTYNGNARAEILSLTEYNTRPVLIVLTDKDPYDIGYHEIRAATRRALSHWLSFPV